MTRHIQKNWHKDFFIETDYKVPVNFWDDYFNGKWEDSNKLYSEYVDEATDGKQMNKFYVQEIHNFDRKLLRLIKNIWTPQLLNEKVYCILYSCCLFFWYNPQ